MPSKEDIGADININQDGKEGGSFIFSEITEINGFNLTCTVMN